MPELSRAEWAEVDQLLSRMTLREKAGQMTQITLDVLCAERETATTRISLDDAKAREIVVDDAVGSILNTAYVDLTPETWRGIVGTLQSMATEETRLGVPLIYGVDSVHGANYVDGATIFPHNLTLAATFEPELARLAGEITAAETRACGTPWNFAPVCDVMRAPAWSRVFETFGEDPLLCGVMASATIEGMQHGDLAGPTTVAATAKHFLGYGAPDSGRDRTPASISTSDLHDTHIPPFGMAFDAGVRSVMVNSGEINGVPVHADPTILHDLLRSRMGFGGVVVTDWRDILKLVNLHSVAADEKEATLLAVNAGIDMAMTPLNTSFIGTLVGLVEDELISESRLDASVRRILALKKELGVFEKTMPAEGEMAEIGSAESNAASLRASRRGIALLRNRDDLLPLAAGVKILVAGPAADALAPLHGSWTYSWQGTDAALYPDTPTILDAVRGRFGDDNVSFAGGVSFDEHEDIDEAVALARSADVILVCLGEQPSVEKPGDISSLVISRPQVNLARRLIATGKPVVLALVTNRPRTISAFEEDIPAILWLGHPGPHGSTALAEILAGDINPSGRLAFTYPRGPNALLTYDRKRNESAGVSEDVDDGYDPLFPFGHGMSFTTFVYEQLAVEIPAGFPENGGSVTVRVRVGNTGDRAGADAVLIFLRDEVASISPRANRLAGFDKVELDPGSSETVTVEIPTAAFWVHGRDGVARIEPGDFTFTVGELTETVRLPRGVPASASGLE